MRLRLRVLILSLCLSLLCSALLSGALLVSAMRADLSRELLQGRAAHDLFAASMRSSVTALSGIGGEDNFLRAVRITAQYMAGGWVGLLSEEGRLIFDNFPQDEAPLLDMMPPAPGQRLTDRQGRQYQLIRSDQAAGDRAVTLLFAWEISAVYAGARARARGASVMLLALCLLLAPALYAALRHSFQPLERLEGAARRIAQGDYAARAPEQKRRDEVGRLSLAFNRMAEATQEHVGRLTAQDVRQKQFIADMAHEMKTPMTGIIGFADLLQRGTLSEAQRQQALHSIQTQGERLERMARKLLLLSRLEAGEAPERRPCQAARLFELAAQAVEGARAEKGIRLAVSPGDQAWPCDSDLMVTLIANLLSNAIRFSEPGSRVWLTAETDGFSVRDEGCGIPKEHLPHVRDAFYMVDKSRARSQQGAGLGLSICSRIAALHGASMDIQSEQGRGTRVSLRFTAS